MPVPPGSQVDGVYLAEEVGNDAPSYSYSFTTPAARERLGSLFWGPASRHIKARLPRLKVAVAPYFFDGTSDDGLVRDRKCACAPVRAQVRKSVRKCACPEASRSWQRA